jgi:hypothetical protein
MVADGYIAAFVKAIEDLDAGTRTKIPQYFLFLDAHYYEANDSRGIITYLENLYDPKGPEIGNEDIKKQVVSAHEKLTEKIESSPSLADLSDEELRGLFKVHVNITNPFDPTFALDVVLRDHRKLGFRDVFEGNPVSGEAIFTGQGIGAHYNGSSWEDRSIEVQGESLVQLKSEVRRIFLGQGFTEEEVPEYLRPSPYPENHGQLRWSALRDSGWTTPVSINTNETGYGYKKATVLKAVMYNLAPKESILLCFDSLWISDFWAGMFVGAALRGALMFPVGPTPANAPSSAEPTLYYLRKNLFLMFQAQQFFEREIEAAGGMLRVGLYAHQVPVEDMGRRANAFIRGRTENPFLKTLFGFDPYIEGLLAAVGQTAGEVPIVALRLRERPLLHLKNQFFGTREAFEVLGLKEWLPVLRAHLEIRQKQMLGRKNPGLTPRLLRIPFPGDPDSTNLIEAFEAYLDTLPSNARDRAIYTFTIGSHNQDPRSLLLDGEVIVAASGYGCLITMIDSMFILGIASWPVTVEEFDELYPKIEPSSIKRWTYGLMKDLL